MSHPNRFTQLKVASGYLLLTALLFLSVGYIYQEMKALTETGNDETTLIQRRHMTNQIIGRLYQAEVIGQSLGTGQLEQYHQYKDAMRQANQALDSLRTLLTDSTQLTRIDTVGMLFVEKERNMRNLLKAIQEGDADKIYKEHIDELIAEQDSLLGLPHVHRKVITHTNSYVIHKKPKGFFKRLGEVFAPGKADSTQVSNVVQEEYTDTLTEAYSPADTVATLLKDIQNRVTETQQQRMERVGRRTQSLRLSGLKLSQKVNQLLNTIEEEEQALAQNRHIQEERIRQNSIRTMAGIAITALVLAVFFLIMIGRDITRSNHYRHELEKAKHRAEDLLAAREKLMLTITHDIKAPVGSILGYTDLLKRITTEERQQFYLDNMKSSADHLLGLVKSLLDFHRLDAHKMDINPVAFNPHQLFDAIYSSFVPMATAKRLTLDYHCNESLNRLYTGDPFRIRQIAENLLSNALKFTQEGSIGLQAALENGQLHFSISDTGCGISPDEQQRIFHEFTRLRNAQGQEGFGLGLAITRKLVLLLEGSINIESEQGKGSCFHVHLPLPESPRQTKGNIGLETAEHTPFRPAATTENRPTALPTLTKDTGSSLQLILIDDDRIQLQLTAAMLERPGVAVTCCHHPEELLHRLQDESFDALLTDIQMPAMNGFELLKAIRALHATSSLPVIAITARSDMDENTVRSHGFAGCLHKPFTTNELLSAIAQATGKRIPSLAPAGTDRNQPDTLHFAALTAFSADDSEAASKIIETFIGETQRNCETMQKALEQKDMETMAATAHKLLPLFTMLEATRCIPTLVWMEKRRGTTEVNEEVTEKTNFLVKEIKKVIAEAQKHYNTANTKQTNP